MCSYFLIFTDGFSVFGISKVWWLKHYNLMSELNFDIHVLTYLIDKCGGWTVPLHYLKAFIILITMTN